MTVNCRNFYNIIGILFCQQWNDYIRNEGSYSREITGCLMNESNKQDLSPYIWVRDEKILFLYKVLKLFYSQLEDENQACLIYQIQHVLFDCNLVLFIYLSNWCWIYFVQTKNIMHVFSQRFGRWTRIDWGLQQNTTPSLPHPLLDINSRWGQVCPVGILGYKYLSRNVWFIISDPNVILNTSYKKLKQWFCKHQNSLS